MAAAPVGETRASRRTLEEEKKDEDPRALNHDAANPSESKERSNICSRTPSGDATTLPSLGQAITLRAQYSFLRLCTFLLHMFLRTSFVIFLVTFSLRHIHETYYKPLFERATRTDAELLEEFTYYKRDCNAYDISTSNMTDLFVDSNESTESNMERFLKHGAMVFPELLTQDEAAELRQYIKRRNAEVTEAEAYPVSQGYNRISYGIDPTEHPAVAYSVQKITTNPTFRAMITNIIGDVDPASAEITAITGFYGCPHQVWHSDTKAVGNALFYSRTYAHSYSVFVPLQNTTAAMGITDLAPGTQYCGNDIQELCEAHGRGINQALSDGVFPAGAGALVNQHTWHRGGAHTDPTAPERIVFILSFISRPKPDDPRMLARGTYFHQQWKMWGMTFFDLMDPYRTMRRPWSVLRCLSIWKPRDRNWGWDLVTSALLRFSNEQLEDNDFYERFWPRLDQFRVPSSLRGEVLRNVSQKKVWTHFIQTTIDKLYNAAKCFCVISHFVLFWGFLLMSAFNINRKSGVAGRALLDRRVLWGYALPAVVTYVILLRIEKSEWGRSITNGRLLMRPFPPPSMEQPRDESLSEGPTTLPKQDDILVGSRFDGRFLGSYDKWLDFHFGNVQFKEIVQSASTMYVSLDRDTNKGLKEHLLNHVKESSRGADGRVLLQDYRTGDWRVMTDLESTELVHGALVTASRRALVRLVKELDYVVAEYRFGYRRGTPLAKLFQARFWHLKRQILGLSRRITKPPNSSNASSSSMSPRPRTLGIPVTMATNTTIDRRFSGIHSRNEGEFRPGTHVWTYFENDYVQGWYPSTVMATAGAEALLVSYDGGLDEVVHLHRVRRRSPLLEGDRVLGCARPGFEACAPGRIARVMPNQDVAIEFDDGTVAPRVTSRFYYRPPYAYLPASDDDDEEESDEDYDDED